MFKENHVKQNYIKTMLNIIETQVVLTLKCDVTAAMKIWYKV